MTYKMTVRGAPPALIFRKYRCTDCEYVFQVTHPSRDGPIPGCPLCASRERAQTAPVSLMPAAPALRTGHLHAAVDMAQEMMEEQGYTDFRDHAKPGDIAVKGPPPLQTAAREAALQEVAELAGPEAAALLEPSLQKQVSNFWQNNSLADVRPQLPGAGGAPAGDANIGALMDKAKSVPIRHTVEGTAKME